MTSGIINVLVGVVGVAMGLSGHVLIFTHSSEALMVAGGAIAALGIYQIVRAKKPS